MKRCARLFAIICLVLFVFTGCAPEKVYGKDDTEITVKEGKQFTIKLKENMTTGYAWNYVIGDETIVQSVSDDYEADDKTGELVGSGGVRILVFKALKQGSTDMTFRYEPTYEKNVSADKHVYQVTVEK